MRDLIGIQEVVANAVVGARDLAGAYSSGLAALVQGLDWHFGAAWEPAADGEGLHCVSHWAADAHAVERFSGDTVKLRLAPGTGLPGRVWGLGHAVRIDDVSSDPGLPRADAATAAGLRSAVAFPLRSERGVVGVIEAFGPAPLPADESVLRSLELVGVGLGLIVERRHSEGMRDAADRRYEATLQAALDAIVTMDHRGMVIEFNPAAQRTFGYGDHEVVGRELAELIVPPQTRAAHRAGLRLYLETGQSTVLDRRVEIDAMRADGTLLPVELAITRIDVPGPPMFTAHIRDISERLAAEAELLASRRRIVKAADESRRRIERDLHDGAQQQLVSVALSLRLARSLLEADMPRAREIMLEAEQGLSDALAELRELARGIHPAVLSEGGLPAALASLARRSPIPVTLSPMPPERLPIDVESTVYFVVAEALTNVARHAAGSIVEIDVRRAGELLLVRVADDGRGGADPSGSGLRGLDDRLASVGGALHVESPSGVGTTLLAEVPCAS